MANDPNPVGPGHYSTVVMVRCHLFPEFVADTVDAVRYYASKPPLIVVSVDRNEDIEKAMRPAYPNVLYYTSQSNCFAGDTRVSLLDGTERSLESLVGEHHWFYGCDGGRVVPNRGLVVKTGHDRKLLEVELDNGEKVRCTSDHEWMLRDGSYRRADQLQAEDSLMPLYRRLSNEDCGRWRRVGYEQFLDPVSGTWEYTHQRVAVSLDTALDFRQGKLIPSIKTKYHRTVHHRDFDKKNNTPENLVWMKWLHHKKYHQTSEGLKAAHDAVRQMVVDGTHPWQSDEHRERSSNQMVEMNRSDEARERASQRMSQYNQENNAEHNRSEKMKQVSGDKLREWNKENLADRNRSPQMRESSRQRMKEIANRNVACPLCGRKMKGAGGGYQNHIRKCQRENAKVKNHKVVAVRPIDGLHDTYCIQTEHPCHNFALSAGIFVQNCGWGGGLFRLFCEAITWLCKERKISFDVLWNIDYDLIPIGHDWDVHFIHKLQTDTRIGQLGKYNPNSTFWKRRVRQQLVRLKKTFSDHGKQWPRNYKTGDHVAGACGIFKGSCIAQMLSMGLLERPFRDLGAACQLADDPMLSLMVAAAGYQFKEMGDKAYIKWRMEEDYRKLPAKGFLMYHPTKMVPGNGPYSARTELQCRNYFRKLRGQGELKMLKESPSTGRPNSILC